MDPNAPLPPHLDPRGRHRGNRAKNGTDDARAGAARIALSLGSVLSIALLVLAGYAFYTYRSINNGVTRFDIGTGRPDTQNTNKSTTHFDAKDYNILLVGNDDRTNMTADERHKLHTSADGGSMNTDTMMILHVPANGKKAVLISLPRDSYVDIPGHTQNRLNAAYPDGYAALNSGSVNDRKQAGARLLTQTVSNLTGLTINHYVQVSLLGFYEISNAIGGVPIDLCRSVDDSAAANSAAGLPRGSGFKMSKGKHTISGVTALEFVRQRHFLANGDLDREKRQQYFLTAAFRQVAGPAIITKLNGLGDAVKRNIYIDSGLNLTDLALQLEALSANNITSHTIPNYAEKINGMDVQGVDPAKVQAKVAVWINPPAASPSTSPSSTSKSPSTSSSAASPSAAAPIDRKCVN